VASPLVLFQKPQTHPFVDRPQQAAQARLLRLSVTDRCNFRCRYCMPASGIPLLPRATVLPLDELADNVRWLSQRAPIEGVKVTGGEPLVRRDLDQLVASLAELPNIREISLTTNGTLLREAALPLKRAGLARVSVSLDSLDRERFAQVSRGGRLEETLSGIDAALEAGLTPLKLNTVLQRSTWKEEVPMILDFASGHGVQPRFIELMRTGTERSWCESEFVSVTEVREWLQTIADVFPMKTSPAKPARLSLVTWRNVPMKVGWIAPRSHPFCSACDRLRMDSRGRLRRCLMDPTTLDLAGIRRVCGEQAAATAFSEYMSSKRPPNGMDMEYAMSEIGG
jgi:GTP 3',8-cyclase